MTEAKFLSRIQIASRFHRRSNQAGKVGTPPHIIWSWVKPPWGSVSIASVEPGVMYLTKLKPSGRPPYW